MNEKKKLQQLHNFNWYHSFSTQSILWCQRTLYARHYLCSPWQSTSKLPRSRRPPTRESCCGLAGRREETKCYPRSKASRFDCIRWLLPFSTFQVAAIQAVSVPAGTQPNAILTDFSANYKNSLKGCHMSSWEIFFDFLLKFSFFFSKFFTLLLNFY